MNSPVKFEKGELARYSRQWLLPEIGIKGQEKLKAARVLVIGAGGLGCPVLLYLNSMGVGTLGIIDFDQVEVHNLHRQILYGADDIGKSKAETAATKLKAQNPYTKFIVFNELLQESNAEAIFAQFDVVVDGCDNFMTRYLVNDVCVKLGKPLIYGSILKFEGQLAVFNYKGSKNLRDLFPEAPDPEDVPNCDENGVLGILPGVIGTYMAFETANVICLDQVTVNVLTMIDLLSGTQRKLRF